MQLATYSGGCFPCLDDIYDDDSRKLRANNNGQEMEFYRLWETQLEHYFQEGPYSSLSRVSNCQIDMDVADNGPV